MIRNHGGGGLPQHLSKRSMVAYDEFADRVEIITIHPLRETGEMAGLSFAEGYGEVLSLESGSQVVPWLLLRAIQPFYGLFFQKSQR